MGDVTLPREKMPLALFLAVQLTVNFKPGMTEVDMYDIIRKYTSDEDILLKACLLWTVIVEETKRQAELGKEGTK